MKSLGNNVVHFYFEYGPSVAKDASKLHRLTQSFAGDLLWRYMVSNEIKWPQKGDHPFLVKSADPQSSTWCSLNWFASWEIDDSFFAEGFKESADKIIKELRRGENCEHPDIYFLPIAYLYRHSLELKMKQIVKLALRIELLESSDEIDDALKWHNLHKLWNHSKASIKKHWPDSSGEELNAAERIIQEFHKIDKTGQNLRYSTTTSGNPTVSSLPEAVDLIHLKDIFEAIYNFLDGCETGLYEALQVHQDSLSDCQD